MFECAPAKTTDVLSNAAMSATSSLKPESFNFFRNFFTSNSRTQPTADSSAAALHEGNSSGEIEDEDQETMQKRSRVSFNHTKEQQQIDGLCDDLSPSFDQQTNCSRDHVVQSVQNSNLQAPNFGSTVCESGTNQENEEKWSSPPNLLLVLALIGKGVSAAADESQQIVYISGQMHACTELGTSIKLENRCFCLRLASSVDIYNKQPSIRILILYIPIPVHLKYLCILFDLYL